MAMAVTYTRFGGMLIHESRGGVETAFVPDTLGSVAATLDSNGNVTSTTEYWPDGEVAASTGTNPSPFGYVGLLGYYNDGNRLYVQNRELDPGRSAWLQVDRYWPIQPAYGYAWNNPVQFADPSGDRPQGEIRQLEHMWMCERRVVPGAGFHGISHWWIEVDCGRKGGSDFGFGNTGLMSGYIENCDQQEVIQTRITITVEQKQCLCDLIHKVYDLGWKLCGSYWRMCDYDWRSNNCQDFVTCLCRRCKIPECSKGRPVR